MTLIGDVPAGLGATRCRCSCGPCTEQRAGGSLDDIATARKQWMRADPRFGTSRPTRSRS